MRIFILIILTLSVSTAPAHAGKTFWQVVTGIFEEEGEKLPDPSETLQAPFAYNPARIIEKDKPLPVNSGVPLDKPHRTTKEIAEWLMITASDVLTFEAGKSAQDFDAEKNNFTPSGKKQYEDFLTQNSIMQVIKSGRYHMHGIVGKTPLLINEGERDGIYRWLFEIEAMVSYIETGNFDYKKQDAVNQKLDLTVQIRRVPENINGLGGEKAIAIEIWKGKAKSLDKK